MVKVYNAVVDWFKGINSVHVINYVDQIAVTAN